MKKVSKVLSLLCALALVVALFPVNSAEAAEVKVAKTVGMSYQKDEYGFHTTKTVEKEVYLPEGKILFTAEIPVFESVENPALAKKVNKTVKKYAVTEAVAYFTRLFKEAGYEEGDNYVMEVTNNCCEIKRMGNVMSVLFLTTAGYQTSAYPVSTFESINISLNSGKIISKTSQLFKSSSFKKAVLKEVKAQIADMQLQSAEQFGLYDEIDYKAVKAEITMQNLEFTPAGAVLYINEGVIGSHAAGVFQFKISKELLEKYMIASKKQILEPLSASCITLPTNPSTGYHWGVEFISGDNYVQLVDDVVTPSSMNSLLVGAPAEHTFFFRAVNPGTAVITLVKYSPIGEAVETQEITVIVNEDLFFMEANGEA